MGISSKTIDIIKQLTVPLASVGVIPQAELNQLFTLATKSQKEGLSDPLILISRAKAAKILDISQRGVDRLIKQGAIPCVRVGKRTVRLDQRQIERYVEKNTGCEVPVKE